MRCFLLALTGLLFGGFCASAAPKKPTARQAVVAVAKEADGVGVIVRLGRLNKLPLGVRRGVVVIDLKTKKVFKADLNFFHGTPGARHVKQISLRAANVACHNATFRGSKAKKATWLVSTKERVQMVGLGWGMAWLGPESVGERIAEVVRDLNTAP